MYVKSALRGSNESKKYKLMKRSQRYLPKSGIEGSRATKISIEVFMKQATKGLKRGLERRQSIRGHKKPQYKTKVYAHV